MNQEPQSVSSKIIELLQISLLPNSVCFIHRYDIFLWLVFQGCLDMILLERVLFQSDQRIWASNVSFLSGSIFQGLQCNRVQRIVSNSLLHFYSLCQFQVLGLINLKPHQQSKVKSHNFVWRNLKEFHPFLSCLLH